MTVPKHGILHQLCIAKVLKKFVYVYFEVFVSPLNISTTAQSGSSLQFVTPLKMGSDTPCFR